MWPCHEKHLDYSPCYGHAYCITPYSSLTFKILTKLYVALVYAALL